MIVPLAGARAERAHERLGAAVLAEVRRLLNNRHRKALEYRTPAEVRQAG